MKATAKKYNKILLLTCLSVLFSSCIKFEDAFTDSIFEDEPATNTQSEFYPFNKWLEENYLKPYNLDFRYRMQDAGSSTDYNLIPADLDKAKQIAILSKYLWFDVYKEAVNPQFLKQYGPRIIHLIGSGAYNPRLHTVVLGTAEAGIKITLYECNQMDPNRIDLLNEYYFKTMHHEFAHILHQKKTFPKEFETFSAGYYDVSYWQERTDSEAASLGFASPYGSSQPREDFVEIIANYIVRSDEWWESWKDAAAKPGVNRDGVQVSDPLDGKAIIETKIEICRKWLKESWDVDLDALRANVAERQLKIKEALAEGYEEINAYKHNE
ncbi:MAG: putative zinc-binding metallopeptidase [Dysgonamonadaceae bacterium]|jgi:substrate import-associated zinc metallohydrolase lipoprotein|nr:putative zinc-binding metallopeptidase [Dysgonamonadaceae bacterium]